MGLCRRLWDFLSEVSDQRRSSPAHLTRWYNLVGHCLRPGFGDALDRHRIEQLWKMLAAPVRTTNAPTARVAEGGADFWILWRRVSGRATPAGSRETDPSSTCAASSPSGTCWPCTPAACSAPCGAPGACWAGGGRGSTAAHFATRTTVSVVVFGPETPGLFGGGGRGVGGAVVQPVRQRLQRPPVVVS